MTSEAKEKDQRLISISKNFQVSVNISYDLHDRQKIHDFIPTKESLSVIERLFESAFSASSDRSHILIGAYGKGKSHIVLEALNLLFEKDEKLFERLLEKIKEENSGFYDDVQNYLLSKRKILPVIISGSSTSLSQSFLLSLYQTLRQNNLERFMPDTNFKAAVTTIQKWEKEYPLAYKALKNELSIPVKDFVSRLNDFDDAAYFQFEKIYPRITSGSVFNPFANFDIVELYENVSKKLSDSDEGFEGIFLVYDEFSKYLESSISKASINDIKLLQDFAEKCCRTSSAGNKNQLHLLLISHKEFSNYIDKLPKEKVDGWKGVSERFKHIVLNSDYSQVYQVIGEVIKKDKGLWAGFLRNHKEEFDELSKIKSVQKLFYYKNEECKLVAENCYPLSPMASYILPRLSEKIAQNERTMFTFLAGNEKNSLSAFLENKDFDCKMLHFAEPDILFDYFEGQLRSESYTSPIKKIYSVTKKCLEALKDDSGQKHDFEEKILKTLCLIYCLGQFERISPTAETLVDVYSFGGDSLGKQNWKNVSDAIENLRKKNLLYLSRSNGFLILKENSNLDLQEILPNIIEKRKHKISEVEILNAQNQEKFLYPVKYNIQKQMTRYFDFMFYDAGQNDSFAIYEEIENKTLDGLALALIFTGEKAEEKARYDFAKRLSEKLQYSCIILRKGNDFKSLATELRELDAIEFLKAENAEDKILCDELTLIEDDLFASVQKFIVDFTHPENEKCCYFYLGEEKKLYRRSQLDCLLSDICDSNFTKTPVVNNETLNKNILSGAADKSRRILIDAILNSEESDLGITGGQELSFMRSALGVTGILPGILPGVLPSGIPDVAGRKSDYKSFDTTSDNLKENYKFLFASIASLIKKAEKEEIPAKTITDCLCDKKNKIALRRGVLPIYLAVAFSKIKRNVVIKSSLGEQPLSSLTLCDLAQNPECYTLELVSFDQPKAIYVKELCRMFGDMAFGNEAEDEKITYSQLVNLMLSWYRALPKYSREKRKDMKAEDIRFMGELKNALSNSQKFLFGIVPHVLGSDDFANVLIQKIQDAKGQYERALSDLEEDLARITKSVFEEKLPHSKNESLCSVYKRFSSALQKMNPEIMSHKFENGAENIFVVFENCGGDEHKLVSTLSPVLTGINTVDWNDSTIATFERRLREFTNTLFDYAKSAGLSRRDATSAEGSQGKGERQLPKNEYRILFADERESVHFSKIQCSKKAESLGKELLNILDEYGQSVSKSEKREVLMKVLKELC